jgi:hypothetical protein
MFHYLFTNDLRISSLESSLIDAARHFKNDTVPTAAQDKSANNNMMTLGFYFNLYHGSNCSEIAAEGNVRKVVLNFIRKFQFPNIRTTASFNDSVSDGIKLAPMRLIVKLLFTMQMSEGNRAYLTKDEIADFIFYNNAVAKVKNPDVVKLYYDIKEYRRTKKFPESVGKDINSRVWKQEDRQIREMVKILKWSGFVVENSDGSICIQYERLSNEDKADIFEIATSTEFWEGNTIDSYHTYMDVSEFEITKDVVSEKISKEYGFNERLTGGENILLYGVPGAGKSHIIKSKYCSNEKYIERVVFHPDYTYSDFVGQILPRVVDDGLKYVFTPGPFTKMLKKAKEDPTHRYYLIIEEINRGNAPAIFGEIFQLLDRKDEDGGYPNNEIGESEYGISNYDVAVETYKDETHQVKIPSNLSIIATMNTSDQNIFTLDTAFQRRWDMRHIKNNVFEATHAQEKIEGTAVSWGAFATVINEMVIENSIDMVSSDDKRLGAYFAKKRDLTTNRFSEKVLKYLWDDAFKMEKDVIFKEEYKSLEHVICAYESSTGDRLSTVLKSDVYMKMLTKTQTPQAAVEE